MGRKKKELPKLGDIKITHGKTYEFQEVIEDFFVNHVWECIDLELEYLFGDGDKPKSMDDDEQKERYSDFDAYDYLNRYSME
ncbi:MAG TPA: hypothetical protein VIM42_05685 [Clostridium sp.]